MIYCFFLQLLILSTLILLLLIIMIDADGKYKLIIICIIIILMLINGGFITLKNKYIKNKYMVVGGNYFNNKNISLVISLLFNVNNDKKLMLDINIYKLNYIEYNFVKYSLKKINDELQKLRVKVMIKNNHIHLVKMINKNIYEKFNDINDINNLKNEIIRIYNNNEKNNITYYIEEEKNIISNSHQYIINLMKKKKIKYFRKIDLNINNKIQWESDDSYTWSVGKNQGKIIMHYPDFNKYEEKIKYKWNEVNPFDKVYNLMYWNYNFRRKGILYHEYLHILEILLYNDTNNSIDDLVKSEWIASTGNFILWFELNKNNENCYIYEFLLYHKTLITTLMKKINNEKKKSVINWIKNIKSDKIFIEGVIKLNDKIMNTFSKNFLALLLIKKFSANKKTMINFLNSFLNNKNFDAFISKYIKIE